MSTTTNLSSLVINYLTQAQYDAASQAGTLNENQIYLTPAVELATVATSGSYNDLSNKPTIPNVPSWALQSSKPSYSLSEISGTNDLQSIEGLSGTSGLLKKTAANTWTLDTNTYLTSYTETDPVFSASAAAGITATDISNWNAKVSDDKTWNGVTLNKQTSSPTWNIYLPFVGGTNNENAYYVTASTTPTANYISKYDANSYLYSTTPSANDNSTKVATTAYVDAAIPNTSSFVSKSGDTMTGNLTMDANKLIFSINNSANIVIKHGQGGMQAPILDVSAAENGSIYIRGVRTPSSTTDAANKQYVDDSIPKVYSSTNTGGYLTMATLPIYDGTVV